jgi:hypothetical protein
MSTLSRLGPLPLFRVRVGDALATGLGNGQAVTVTYEVSNFINGRVRGNFNQDQAGTLRVRFGNDSTTMDLDFDVPQCPLNPPFQYPFDIVVLQPFVQFEFTNGVVPSTFFRAFMSALPV